MVGMAGMHDARAKGAGPEFPRRMVDHHQEGIRLTDRYLPRLTRPEEKPMAEKGKSEQQRDIETLNREMGRG